MEVRIGMREVNREVTLESNDSAEAVSEAVTKALATPDGLLTLTDEKGRTVLVASAALAYVEIGPEGKGRVGFGRP